MLRPLGALVTRGALAALAMFGLWSALQPDRSHACSCMESRPVAFEWADSASVFQGEVISVRKLDGRSALWEFDVKTVWKGGNGSGTMLVETNWSQSACGFDFYPDVDYLVYTYDTSREHEATGLCGRNAEMSEALGDVVELWILWVGVLLFALSGLSELLRAAWSYRRLHP